MSATPVIGIGNVNAPTKVRMAIDVRHGAGLSLSLDTGTMYGPN
jgi:hypothetical protein